MAKGQKAKKIISDKILNIFGDSFLYNDGKEIRIPIEEDGEIIQIKVILTAAKASVEPGSDNEIPTAANIINNVDVNKSVINQVDSTTIVKPSEEEKQNLQNMLSKLGL